MGIAAVDEMGRSLERAWRAVDYDLRGFPQLCAEHLEAARLHERMDPDQVVALVLDGNLPQQRDPLARFGQPPVTLFRERRFYIDALFWVDGTTSIHDHAFSGAFQVLAGASIETTFSFASARDVDGHFRFGGLGVRGSGLRRPGDVRAIPAGPVYIHSLFHLVRPSVTIVIRTFWDPVPAVQLEYSPAGLAYDPFLEDPARDRMVQTVEMLRKTEHPRFERLVGDAVAACDLNTAFSLLRSCTKLTDSRVVEGLIGRVRDPEAAARIRDWFSERRRLDFLISRRALVHDVDLRFLLAVLMNAQKRTDALALVAAYAPGAEPARQMAAWLRALAGTTMKLQVAGAPFEPNVLGLPAFDGGGEEALADALSGRARAFTPEEQAFLDRLRALPPLRVLFA